MSLRSIRTRASSLFGSSKVRDFCAVKWDSKGTWTLLQLEINILLRGQHSPVAVFSAQEDFDFSIILKHTYIRCTCTCVKCEQKYARACNPGIGSDAKFEPCLVAGNDGKLDEAV